MGAADAAPLSELLKPRVEAAAIDVQGEKRCSRWATPEFARQRLASQALSSSKERGRMPSTVIGTGNSVSHFGYQSSLPW